MLKCIKFFLYFVFSADDTFQSGTPESEGSNISVSACTQHKSKAICCTSSILRNIAGSVHAWKNCIFLFTFPPNLMVKKGIFVLIYIKILFRKYFQIWDTKQLFSKDVFQYFTLDLTYPIVPKYTSVTRSVLLAAQAMGSIIIKWEYP